MEPRSRQVRNHNSQRNREAHQERELTFNKATNHHCQWNVCHPTIRLIYSWYWWLIFLIWLVNKKEDKDQEIGEDEGEDTWEAIIPSDIEENDFNQQKEVIHSGKVHRDKSFRTTRVPLTKIQTNPESVVACPLLRNAWDPPVRMAAPLVKCQKSTLLNIILESDHGPSTWTLISPNKSRGDQNIPQPEADSDKNIPQPEKATSKIVEQFVKAIVFTMNSWPLLFD